MSATIYDFVAAYEAYDGDVLDSFLSEWEAIMDAPPRFFAIADDDGTDGEIVVKVTDEGVIVDLEVDGEVVKTWGATAQELADEFCH